MTDTPLFAGLKVIDCATYIAAPTAATVLADYGAEVIKIEAPGEGDPWRNVWNRPGQPVTPHNFPWLMDNRNKRGLVLDLKAPAGRAVLERLVSQSDIFITNLPLPVRERLRVRYADFAEQYPKLIYASLTAYGEAGPESGKTGFDLTAYWGRSGLMDQVRADAAAPPARSVAGMGDHPTAISLYGAIVTALYQRDRTGKGAEVRASLMANGMWANSILIQASLCGADVPSRAPRMATTRALGEIYRCADDRFLQLALSSEVRQWPALVQAIGRPDLLDDPRFATPDDRRHNAPDLMLILDSVFADHPLAHWRRALDAAGLTFGITGTVPEIAADEQARAAGILRPLADTGMLTVDTPFTITGTDKVPVTLAPDLGQHSRDVLRDAGYSDGEIETLQAAGTVGGR